MTLQSIDLIKRIGRSRKGAAKLVGFRYRITGWGMNRFRFLLLPIRKGEF